MNNTVVQVNGKNGGKHFTNGNGFFYRVRDKPSNKRWKLCCKNSRCRGTAVLHNPNCEKIIEEKSSHSCRPDLLYEETSKLREDILHRCKTEFTPSSEVFREECTKR